MRALLYARFSTDRQTEASIDDQLRRCRDFAQARGWRIGAEFTDQGISGAAFGNRPGVQAALAQLQRGDVLVVMDLSRLSRSQELAPLIERLRFNGARVVGVLDGYDSESAQARMQAGLSGIMSEELRASIRQRTHSALELRALRGQPTGGRAYGFDASGAVRPDEAEVVREIFHRYASGETLKGIVSDLNRRNVPAPGATWARETRRRDGRWIISAVHAMLRNERYVGRVIWNRSEWIKDPDTGQRIRRERPRSQWIINEVEPLVGMALWQSVQARCEARGGFGPGPGGQPRYLLSGLLVCDACGGRLIVTGSKGSHYYCGTHRQGGAHACSMGVGVRRDVAEAVLLRPVIEDLLSPAAVEHAAALIRRWAQQERAQTAEGGSPEVAEIDGRIARLRAQVEAGALDGGDIAPAIEALQQRRDRAMRAAWLVARAKSSGDEVPAERLYRDAARSMLGRLTGSSMVAAREALREVMGAVRVRPDESGTYLIADTGVSAEPLLAAAGIASSGSGGVLWPQAIVSVRFVRAA